MWTNSFNLTSRGLSFLALGLLVALLGFPGALAAQDRRSSHCIAIAQADPALQYLHKAAWQDPVPEYSVRIRYLTHSSFLIQTVGGLSAVTDYNGTLGPAQFTPDVVTMNHAHGSHWTPLPDPDIPHVLQGWGDTFGTGVDHHLDLGEMLVRNVSTDIRSGGGVEREGNSIFVFEVEGLCIGHMGHLHHEPTASQYAALGRLDIVMVPVDGGQTLPLSSVLRIVAKLKSSLVIPMHWFSLSNLQRFLLEASPHLAIEVSEDPEIEVSLRSLPRHPTILVLRPELLF